MQEYKTMDREDNTVTALLMDIAGLLREFPQALEQRAAEIQVTGKDPELASKLIKGADAMRDSGNIYLSWAKHYADLSEGNSDASTDEDESEDFDV
ncbi:MAG: hypothetical protein AB7G48_06615 [Nitrospiraceae bacterium]